MRQLLQFGISVILTAALIGVVSVAYNQAAHHSKLGTLNGSATAAVKLLDSSIAEAISVGDLVRARGQESCSVDSRDAFDQLVFLSTQLKAIIVVDGDMTCSSSGYAATKVSSDFLKEGAQYSDANAIRLWTLPDQYGGVGVSRIVDDGASDVIALISANTYVAATIDPDIITGANAAFVLDNGEVMVGTPSFGTDTGAIKRHQFTVGSALYPYAYMLDVPATHLWTEEMALGPAMSLLVVFVFFLAGYLFTTRFIMPDRPSDIIKRAIESGEIQPYFQPVLDLNTGGIHSFEVLSRWVKPSGQIVGPSEFIAEVERYDLSPFLLRSLIKQTGKSMEKLIDRFAGLRFAFNVAPDTFTETTFVVNFKHALEASCIAPDRVTIEVTERQEITDLAQARLTTQELQQMGVHVAIDDVGTGHNGLSTITAMAPNEIKIDKYFIDGLPDNQRALSMVRMLVRTAHSLGMKTVAEGIENHKQVEALMALRVDFAQGFHMARPVSADAAIGLFCEHYEKLNSRVGHKQVNEMILTDTGEEMDLVTAYAA
ncbi:MAG: EAL domain-containing protein [Pseudomonadota bacterium]